MIQQPAIKIPSTVHMHQGVASLSSAQAGWILSSVKSPVCLRYEARRGIKFPARDMEKLLDFGSRRISAGKKRGTALILLRRAGEGGKEEGRRVHKERYTHRRRRIVAADLAGFIRKGREQGRKEGRAEEGKGGRGGTKISFQGQRSPRSAFISGALLPFLLPSIGGRAHVFKRRPSLCKPARTCSDLPLDLCQVLFIFILHKNILLSYV